MKNFLPALILSVSLVPAVNAQNRDRDRFDQFAGKARSEFHSFRDGCKAGYAEFLRQAWAKYRPSAPVGKPEEEMTPPVEYRPEEHGRDTVVIKDIKDENIVNLPPKPVAPEKPVPPVQETPVPPVRETPVPPVRETPVPPAPPVQNKPSVCDTFCFRYGGTDFSVRRGGRVVLGSVSENDVSDAWEALGSFDVMLSDCLSIRKERHLCDWAYLMMLRELGAAYTSSRNEAVLLTAYLFAQSGYRVRLARGESSLYLLYASPFCIFGKPHYTIEGRRFYALDCNESSLEIAALCELPISRDLSLEIDEEPSFDFLATESRTISASGISVNCTLNRNELDFYGTYPESQYGSNSMTRWAIYANTPVSGAVKEQIYPALRASIEGKTTLQALNVLLDFVQKAFVYELDDDVWGRDRVFFAEETLYYPYCDCEDRSILFSHLVRDLLGLEVVLVYYPGHIATAVKTDGSCEGDRLITRSGDFLVCDPTYIGAPAGTAMPEFRDGQATVILLN